MRDSQGHLSVSRQESAKPRRNLAKRKVLPRSRRIQGYLTDVVKVAVLNPITPGEGFAPHEAQGINQHGFLKLDHDPLRMKRVVFAGKLSIEIRVTLPKCFRIAVVDSRVA